VAGALKLMACLACVGGVSAVLVLGYYAVIQAPYFQVKGVEISGSNRVQRAELLKRMEINPGVNLLELNLRKIITSVESMPWIERASVRRRFPDHLVVRIWEYEPRALIQLEGFYYLDKQGTAFKRVEQGENLDYPVVTGIPKEMFYSNSAPAREILGRVTKVMTLLESEKTPLTMDQISEISVTQDKGITLVVKPGLKINLGTARFEEKFKRLEVVRQDLTDRGRWSRVKSIDLDLGNRALVS